mmetsp:Transcript_70141/g.86063  ORF Transcript_70141/g.86063 Transcript_70141/m.86063 type:complete len:276 (-) Transcript_70141:74-901(-)
MSRNLLYHSDDENMNHYPGGYITNHVIGVLSLIFMIILIYLKKLSFKECFVDGKLRLNMSALICLVYFIGAITYIVAGLVHEYWPHNNETPGTPIEWHIFWRIALITHVLYWCVRAQIIKLIYKIDNINVSEYITMTWINYLLSIIILLGFIYPAIKAYMTAVGFLGLISFITIGMCIYQMIKKKTYLIYSLFIGAAIFQFGTYAMIPLFVDACGKYPAPDCPFSTSCDHICVSHIWGILSVILHFIAALLIKPKNEMNNQEIQMQQFVDNGTKV